MYVCVCLWIYIYYLSTHIKCRIICVFSSDVGGVIFWYWTANSCKWSNIERYSTSYCFEGMIKEHARDNDGCSCVPVYLCEQHNCSSTVSEDLSQDAGEKIELSVDTPYVVCSTTLYCVVLSWHCFRRFMPGCQRRVRAECRHSLRSGRWRLVPGCLPQIAKIFFQKYIWVNTYWLDPGGRPTRAFVTN